MQKKRYAPPTITELGEVVEETRGTWGGCWESFGSVYCPEDDIGDGDDDTGGGSGGGGGEGGGGGGGN